MTEKYRNTPKGRIAPNGYRLCDPLPEGQILIDTEKKHWVIGKTIGLGGFGEIYLIHEKDSPSNECVMKLDNTNGPLFVEVNFVLRACQKNTINAFIEKRKLSFLGVPRFIASGTHQSPNGGYRFLIMERLGEELQKVLETKRLSIAVTCRIACRIIDVLEYIHDQGYIHADIKAQNILRSTSKNDNNNKNNNNGRKKRKSDDSLIEDDDHYYLIDYGLVEKYTFQGVHKPYEADKRRANNGTCEFRSRDAHIGVISRRSDIESLGYNLILWFYGRHPWGNILKDADKVYAKKQWAMKNISEFLKESFNDKPMDDEDVLEGSKGSKTSKSKTVKVEPKKNIPINTIPPKGLNKFFEEINSLPHDARPNYEKYKDILENIAKLNPQTKLINNVLNGSPKKSRMVNDIDKKNNSFEMPKTKRTCRVVNKKKPTTNNVNILNMNGQMTENDDTELEEDEQEELEDSAISSRSKTTTKSNSGSGSGSKKTVGSNRIELETPSSSRNLRARGKAIKSTNNNNDGEEEDADDNYNDENVNRVQAKKSPTKTINPPPQRSRKYSTPLIIESNSDDSPLFGPFESEETFVINNNVKEKKNSRNSKSKLTNGFSVKDDSGISERRQNSARIYIDNRRYRPKQSFYNGDDEDDEKFKDVLIERQSNKKSNHRMPSFASSSSSVTTTAEYENDHNPLLTNGQSSSSSARQRTLNNNNKKATNTASSSSSSSTAANQKKLNGLVVAKPSSKQPAKNNTNKKENIAAMVDGSASSNAGGGGVPETAAMQRIRMMIQNKKKKA